jgi:hypothetical protein
MRKPVHGREAFSFIIKADLADEAAVLARRPLRMNKWFEWLMASLAFYNFVLQPMSENSQAI